MYRHRDRSKGKRGDDDEKKENAAEGHEIKRKREVLEEVNNDRMMNSVEK